MRKYLIAGNWKMNKTLEESEELVKGLLSKIKQYDDRDILVCPPFTSLSGVSQLLKDSRIKLGGQNLHFEENGAYTGEISGHMLKAVGCEYVILGHSERREYYGETDDIVRTKILRAKEDELIPILCLGEKLDEREKGVTEEVVSNQLTNCLKDVPLSGAEELVIAYEPVWAIGTGKTATPEQAQEVHALLREIVGKLYNKTIRDEIQILYGGSMNAKNAQSLLSQPDIDGGLIGGASLKIDDFVVIIESL
ncbi:triose-phosphate isomerase [candidate division KSB1 bacterium]